MYFLNGYADIPCDRKVGEKKPKVDEGHGGTY